MSALVQVQRYNWMGYHGTETDEVNTGLLRGDGKGGDVNDYERRQQIIADVQERLYQIKKDLDLIPEEEVRAEEEQRERRRQARKAREEEERRRKEEAERQREAEAQRRRDEAAAQAAADAERQRENEARAAEEAEKRKEEEKKSQAFASRWRAIHNSDEDSEAEEERNELLENYPRTQEEIDDAVKVFGQGCRCFLLGREEAGYTSYLDGTQHLTLTKLNYHNAKYRDGARMVFEANRDENKDQDVQFPEEEEFHTEELAQLLDAREHARKKLDAYRCHHDETYIARLRDDEKTADGLHPSTALTEDELAAEDESQLRAQLEAAQREERQLRGDYNIQAASTAAALSRVMYSKVEEGAAEGVVVAGDDGIEERDFARVPITTMAAAPVSASQKEEEEEAALAPETVVASTRVKSENEPKSENDNHHDDEDEYHEIGDPVKPESSENHENENENEQQQQQEVAAPVEEHSVSVERPTEEVEEEHVELADKDFEESNSHHSSEKKKEEEEEEEKKKKEEDDDEFNKEL